VTLWGQEFAEFIKDPGNADTGQTGFKDHGFGFVLEEGNPQQLQLGQAQDDESIVARALSTTQALLLSSANNDDEGLAEAASELDRRALDKVRSFVTTLSDYGAFMALQTDHRLVRFDSPLQLARALDALSVENVREEVVRLRGSFGGALPHSRTFEFDVVGGEPIHGKISLLAGDVDEVNRHLHQPAEIQAMRTQVGNGRPRYVLISPPIYDRRPPVIA